jgi:hypothetical protein
MTEPFSLQQIRLVNRARSPVAPAALDELERDIGRLPRGYRDVMTRLGRCAGSVRLGFCGELVVSPPDVVQKRQKELSGYFSVPDQWPNHDELFAAGETERAISFAHTDQYDELVAIPGRDQLFYFPNPRSGDPDIVPLADDLVGALGWYARRRNIRVPYFQSGIGQATTKLKRPGIDEAWRLLRELKADAVDDEQLTLFFSAAEARVHVPDWAKVVLVEHPQSSSAIVDALKARLEIQ